MIAEIQYQPSIDQRALIAALADPLAEILSLARLHGNSTETAETWAALTALGVFGLAAAEDAGGSGLGAVEEAIAVMALGRGLASPSVLATLGAVHAGANPSERITAGFAGSGGVVVVIDEAAEAVLVRGAEVAALHPWVKDDAPLPDCPWLDRLGHPVSLASPIAAFDAAGLLRLRLIDAAALAGLADAALAMAVEYAGLREQFGRPIGSFQAIKHHCANMAVAARSALDLVTFAAVAIDSARPDAAFLAESAFVAAATAALENAGKNIQIHGGIGFSDEAAPQLFLKRAQILIAIGGGIEAAITRLETMSCK